MIGVLDPVGGFRVGVCGCPGRKSGDKFMVAVDVVAGVYRRFGHCREAERVEKKRVAAHAAVEMDCEPFCSCRKLIDAFRPIAVCRDFRGKSLESFRLGASVRPEYLERVCGTVAV